MKKKSALVLLSIALLTLSPLAQAASSKKAKKAAKTNSSAASTEKTSVVSDTTRTSAASAESSPQTTTSQENASRLLNETNIALGARLGLGAVGSFSYAGGTVGFIATGEYRWKEGWGFGGLVGFSRYSWDGGSLYSSGSNYSSSLTHLLILPQVMYHADVFKVKNLDTYVSAGAGYDFVFWSYNGPANPYINGLNYSSVALSAYANARYFVTDRIALSGSLGWGFGILTAGLDVKL